MSKIIALSYISAMEKPSSYNSLAFLLNLLSMDVREGMNLVLFSLTKIINFETLPTPD
jgi:hypothetical protein